jgi:hypothetical protein
VWGDGGAYAAWTSYLERWQADLRTADEPLPPLGRDDFAPQTWVRLTNHIIDAINGRLRAWTDAFTADVAASRSEFAFGRAMVGARTGLASVLRLADHTSLQEDVRIQLRGMVEQQIKSLQQSLQEDTAGLERDGWSRADAEARRRTVRDSPLTAVLTTPATPTAPAATPAEGAPDPWGFDPSQRPRRRLVID